MKPLIILGLTATLLMLTACTLGGPSGGYAFVDARIEALSDESGLILIEASENTENRAETTYQLFIELENRMAQPAENVRVQVSNTNPDIIDFADLHAQAETLGGYENLTGPSYLLPIDANVRIIEPKKTYSTQLRYHLCAQARTVFQDTICVAPPGAPTAYEKTCDPRVREVSGGQQAPVAVTEIRQGDSVNRTSVFIDVVNFGDGLVFDYDTECSRISQDDAGHITLDRFSIAGVDLTGSCQAEARMGFTQKYQKHTGTTFTCTVDKSDLSLEDIDETVTTDVAVELSYGYHVLARTQPIIIRKI